MGEIRKVVGQCLYKKWWESVGLGEEDKIKSTRARRTMWEGRKHRGQCTETCLSDRVEQVEKG